LAGLLATWFPNENIVVLPLLTAKDQFKDKEYTKLDLWSYLTDSEQRLVKALNLDPQNLVNIRRFLQKDMAVGA
jgi:hypothetical protein